MTITLDKMKPGIKGQVTDMYCPEPLGHRLADFGLVPGTWVSCRYQSPGGGLSALELRGSVLAVRAQDLRRICVRLE